MFLSLPATAALFVGSEEIISALLVMVLFKRALFNSAKALFYFGLGFTSFRYDKGFFHFFL